jgi:hypothetical protein
MKIIINGNMTELFGDTGLWSIDMNSTAPVLSMTTCYGGSGFSMSSPLKALAMTMHLQAYWHNGI